MAIVSALPAKILDVYETTTFRNVDTFFVTALNVPVGNTVYWYMFDRLDRFSKNAFFGLWNNSTYGTINGSLFDPFDQFKIRYFCTNLSLVPQLTTQTTTNVFKITAPNASNEIGILALASPSSNYLRTLNPWICALTAFGGNINNKPLNYVMDEHWHLFNSNTIVLTLSVVSSLTSTQGLILSAREVNIPFFSPILVPTTKWNLNTTIPSTMTIQIQLPPGIKNNHVYWKAYNLNDQGTAYTSMSSTNPLIPSGKYLNGCITPFVFNESLGCNTSDSVELTAANDFTDVYITPISAAYNINVTGLTGALPPGYTQTDYPQGEYIANTPLNLWRKQPVSINFDTQGYIDIKSVSPTTWQIVGDKVYATATGTPTDKPELLTWNNLAVLEKDFNSKNSISVFYSDPTLGGTGITYEDHYSEIIKFSPRRAHIKITSYSDSQVVLSACSIDTNNIIYPISEPLNKVWWVLDNNNGLITTPSLINLSANNTATLQLNSTTENIYNVTLKIEDSLNRTPANKNIFLNDEIGINTLQNRNSLTATAIYANQQETIKNVNPSKIITWTAPTLIPSTVTNTANIVGDITYTASTTNTLTAIHEIKLTSNGLSATETFRPFLDLTPTSQLKGVILNSSVDVNNYNISAILYGVSSNGIIHNLDTSQLITYNITSGGSAITYVSLDNFNLNINIITPVYNNTSPYLPDTYTLQCDANSPLPLTNIIFNLLPYISDETFKPILSIEDTFNTLRAPAPEVYVLKDISSITIKLHVADETVAEGVFLNGGNYSFSASVGAPNIVITNGSGTFTSQSDLRTKLATVSISNSINDVTFTLSVTANYSGNLVTKTYVTRVLLIDNISINPNDIKIFPEYKWDNTTASWIKVIDINNFNVLSSPPSVVYANGRTENFIISARNIPGIGVYNWQVIRGDGSTINNIPNTRIAIKDIKSPDTGNENLSLRLSAFTSVGDLPLPPIQLTNAIQFKQTTATLSNPQINIPDTVAVPGDLVFEITSDSAPVSDGPISVRIYSGIINLSSSYWQSSSIGYGSGSLDLNLITIPLYISDIGQTQLSIPKFRATNIKVSAQPIFIYSYITHPKFNDWNTNLSLFADPTAGNVTTKTITSYPVTPFYYTTNKYISLDDNISVPALMENVTVPAANHISGFDWISFNNISSVQNYNPFIAYYNDDSYYSLTITSKIINGFPLSTKNENAIYVQKTYPVYDPLINRKVNDKVALIPNKCGIPSNEWLTNNNINFAFKKIYDNLEHLIKQSKIYDEPPLEYIGWLGAIYLADNITKQFRWFVNIPGLEYAIKTPSEKAINDKFSNLQDCILKDNNFYISDTDKIYIIKNNFNGDTISTRSIKSIGEPFNCIKTIQLDNVDKNKVYLLDTKNPYAPGGSKNNIIVMTYDEITGLWDLLYSWGGVGSATSKQRFLNPQDMFLDQENILWVADTDNLVIKKYTRTGSWLQTIYCDLFTLTNKPISLCKDSNNNLQVLCKDYVVVLDSNNGNILTTYNIDTSQTFIKIRNASEDGFIYITSNSAIYKCTLDGSIQLLFSNFELDNDNIFENRSLFQDEFRNLYVVQKNHILKYNDQLKIISLIDDFAIANRWTFDEIAIKQEEYIQDWVINKSINRLWDNIEVVRKAIKGKLSFEKILTYKEITDEIVIPPSAISQVCLIDWIPGFLDKNVQTEVFCRVIPSIRAFLPGEYFDPVYAKNEILIGVDELVTADVLNRVLCQLQENLKGIYEMLQQGPDKSDELCDVLTPPTISIPDSLRTSLTACYPEYTVYL